MAGVRPAGKPSEAPISASTMRGSGSRTIAAPSIAHQSKEGAPVFTRPTPPRQRRTPRWLPPEMARSEEVRHPHVCRSCRAIKSVLRARSDVAALLERVRGMSASRSLQPRIHACHRSVRSRPPRRHSESVGRHSPERLQSPGCRQPRGPFVAMHHEMIAVFLLRWCSARRPRPRRPSCTPTAFGIADSEQPAHAFRGGE